MAILENTTMGLNKLKKDLRRASSIFSIITFCFFALYYAYLIVINLKKSLYIATYSILFAVVLASFICEQCMKKSRTSTRKQNRIITEQKRGVKAIIKILKYSSKTILLSIAMFEIINSPDIQLSNLITLFLIMVLVLQIIIDIVSIFIIHYIDFLMLCVEKDIEKIKFIQTVTNPKQAIANTLEDVANKINGENKYTKQQEKIINKIEENTQSFKKEKEKQKEEQTKLLNDSIAKNSKIIAEAAISKVQGIFKPKKEKQ